MTARSAAVSGLLPNTTYHFRAVAANAAGTTYGTDHTFTTPALAPTVQTGAASNVSTSGATLGGTIDPNGSVVTQAYFQLGPTTAYGTTVQMPTLPGGGQVAVAGSAPVANLPSGQTYHYRLVAVNAGGTTYGPDQTFKTNAVYIGPPNGPANWCLFTTQQKVAGIVWWRLLNRYPDSYPASWTSPVATASYIITAATELNQDIYNEATTPTNPPANWGAGTWNDHIVAAAFQRFLQRWPDSDFAATLASSVWPTWRNILTQQGIGALCNVFANSAEFTNGVNTQATSYC